MLSFIIGNLATIIISAALLAGVTLIIRKMIRDKKRGKSCCSGCDGCHFNSDCQKH